MDNVKLYEAEFRASHRHADGSWGQLEAEPSQHDPAGSDPERQLSSGRVYRCSACDSRFVITPAEESPNASGQR